METTGVLGQVHINTLQVPACTAAQEQNIWVEHTMSLWLCARATTSAPLIFAPYTMCKTVTAGTDDIEPGETEIRELVDGGFKANCPVKIAVHLAKEMAMENADLQGTPVQCCVSIGTGLVRPQDSKRKEPRSAIDWPRQFLSASIDAETQFQDAASSDLAELQKLEILRINPPDLGSCDPFKSSTVAALRVGVDEFLSSSKGQEQLDHLFNLVFAKMHYIRLEPMLIEGSNHTVSIQIRRSEAFDHITKMMNESDLKNALKERGCSTLECDVNLQSLQAEVVKVLNARPNVVSLPGKFVFLIEDHKQDVDGREFNLTVPTDLVPSGKDSYIVPVDAKWEWQNFSISLSGFPRTMTVGRKSG